MLVIEDNDDGRETLRAVLEISGHPVETAPDGVTGLEKALALAPDVAIVDIGCRGWTASRSRAASAPRATCALA